MSRGVDLDVIGLFPIPPLDALRAALDGVAQDAGLRALASIDEIKLDLLAEWLMPGERCIALTEEQNGWQLVYDTDFSHAALADGLSRALPETLLVQINLQEEVGLTLRVLKKDTALHEYSNAPAHFNWGRCLGKAEALRLERPDPAGLAEAVGGGVRAAALAGHLEIIRAKTRGEPAGTRGRFAGGVRDSVQALAVELGMPRLYRFFEGWMKSDLDWDEDNVLDVRPYRKAGPA